MNGSAMRLGELLGLSPETIAALSVKAGGAPAPAAPGMASAMPVQDAAQLQDAAAGFQAQDQGRRLAEQSAAVDAHNAPMPGAPVDQSRESFHQLANVDFKKLQADNAAKESAANPESAPAQAPVPVAPGVGPTVTTPAHWQPGTHAVTIHGGFDPDSFEDANYSRDVAAGHGILGAEKTLQAAQLRGQADAVYLGAHALATKNIAEIDAAREQRKKAYVADQLQRLDQLNTEAQKKVDPNAEWKARGTLGSVMTGLMIGLGQFASMWKGGPNAAMQIVNDQINNNIDAQKTNIANARGAFAQQSDLYHRNLEAFDDERLATLATKMQYLDQVAAITGQMKVQAGTLDADAAKSNMLKSIYDQKAQWGKDFAELTGSRHTEQMNEHFVPAQTFGGGGGTKREGNLVTLSDGTTYHLQSEKLAEGSIGKIQLLGHLQDTGNRILQLRKETADLPVTEVGKRDANILQLKKLTSEMEQLESAAFGQGVVTKEDHARNVDVGVSGDADLGTLSGLNPFANSNRKATDDAYRDMISRWGQTQHRFVQAAGGEVYDRSYTRAADGSLVPTGNYTGQDAKPIERLAPQGSKPIDNRLQNLPTAGRPDRETIPKAPVRAGVFAPPSAAPSHGGKKRKH